MKWGFFGVGALAGAAFVACQSGIPRESEPRFDLPIPPDAAPDVIAVIPFDPGEPEDAGIVDASTAVDASDAAPPPTGPLLATGSGFHPDPAIGNGDHTCVSRADAGVFCWGANEHGQLGIGTLVDAPSATKLTTDENAVPFGAADELALAPWHSCARRGATLFCWGQRLSGAQAEPPSAVEPDRVLPRAIGNLEAAHVAAGGAHTCVTKSDGREVCFGHSTFGELGHAPTADAACAAPFFYAYQTEPTHACSASLVELAPALPALTAIVAGEVHSCAITNGRVECWGANGSLQLGRTTAAAFDPAPGAVMIDGTTILDGATALAAGGKHSCAIAQGKVLCWGEGAPVAPVAGLANPLTIGVAEGVACAVKADKTAVCWGTDLTALGDAGVGALQVPVAVAGAGGIGLLADIVAIAPGLRHACAEKGDGSVWCWGKNDRGQLGDGTKLDSRFPVKVVGLP